MHRLRTILKIAFNGRWSKVVLLFTAIFFLLAGMGVVRMHVLSSARAFVGAESLYSKAQKDAVFYLYQYASSGSESDFREFRQALSVPMGDRKARLELERLTPDYGIVRQGFLEGGNNADDIADMIEFYRFFRHGKFSIEPISIWTTADSQIMELDAEAIRLRALLQVSGSDQAALRLGLDRIRQINWRLAQTESALSSSLGAATRDVQYMLLRASWVIAVILLLSGVLLARLILTRNDMLENALRISEERLHLAMIADIADRKYAAEQLYAEKERAQVTLESIGDAVVTVNIDGLIDYLNPAAVSLIGWTLADARGVAIASICHMIDESTREKVPDHCAQILSSDRTADLATNLLLVCSDGHEVAVNRSVAPIGNREGRIIGMVFVFHDVSKDRAYATHLSYQASHDELTGLINRREFERRLVMLLPATQSQATQHTMLYLDLDQFKIVNDTCGHIAGDGLLKQLGILLKAKLRQNDTLARLGGDEFGVLLETCPVEPALRVAESFRQAIGDFRFVWQEKVFSIGVSIGLVTFGNDGATLADILRMADAACYVAKDNGRNRIHIFTPEDKELAQRHGEMGWIARIQKALEEQRFVLYSQKILALGNVPEEGEHYEILLRMLDENGALVPPMAFIPAAERYGLMPLLDRWVIRTVFSEYAERHPGKTVSGTCAINLSGTSICDDDFLPFVHALFQQYQVPPSGICFEITETSAIANLGKAEVLIRDLKKLGCRISLDDFGSGMSSFSYLKHLSVDYLKIDGGFVKDMMSDPIDHAMVEAINRIGHVMHIKTIAEFVENDEIMEELRTMEIDFAQGYGVEKPRPCRMPLLVLACEP